MHFWDVVSGLSRLAQNNGVPRVPTVAVRVELEHCAEYLYEVGDD